MTGTSTIHLHRVPSFSCFSSSRCRGFTEKPNLQRTSWSSIASIVPLLSSRLDVTTSRAVSTEKLSHDERWRKQQNILAFILCTRAVSPLTWYPNKADLVKDLESIDQLIFCNHRAIKPEFVQANIELLWCRFDNCHNCIRENNKVGLKLLWPIGSKIKKLRH